MKRHSIISLIALLTAMTLSAQNTHNMVVQTSKIGPAVQSTMYGLFFEDINFGADGGLYAELIKNRSFEFPQHLLGWTTFGKVTVRDDGPFPRCPHYVRLDYPGHPEKHTGIENEGFFGIGVKEGAEYRFSVWARGEGQQLGVELIHNTTGKDYNQYFVQKDLTINSKDWKKYELRFTSPITEAKAHLRIFLKSNGPVDLEHVSLFPVDTWKGRENGLRKDLVQKLYDMHPGVMRFPGGCIVEGTDLATRYYWKNTVGQVENRPLNENRWEYTFTHRFFPDYFQTYGLGFFEFFQLSEDIGAEPLPVLNCGLACQYQNDSDSANVKVSDLGSYIQDALDLIEFANGSTSTKWGKLRADMGHAAPFNLKFIAVGNEQWGPEYVCRLDPFVKAIRKAHPEIKIIGSAGPQSEGKDFEYLWPEMRKEKVDLVDEHFYRPEQWFLSQGNRYDKYPRKGPKVFAGEYACHGNGKGWNHFNAALMEAAFMTGLERNADVVQMATYAPLFAHVEGWQWRPDMIWFDNLRSMGSCSYYVQKLYSLNKGTNVVPLTMNNKPVSGQNGQDGLFASAVWNKNTKEYIVKIINTTNSAQPVELTLTGWKKKGETIANCTTFHSDDPVAENTLDHPEAIVPQDSKVTFGGNTLKTDVGAKTFVIYKFGKE